MEKNEGMTCALVLIGTFLMFLLLFWGGGMAGWGGSLLLNVLLWVGIIILVWWALKQAVTGRSRGEPLETLKGRYAAGEIGRAEFLKMKREISK